MLTTGYVPGAPNWIDLTTPDVTAAAGFYRVLFGWDFRAAGPGAGGYGFFRLDDKIVAAAGPSAGNGAEAAWTPYFHSLDADAAADDVERAGGTVRVAPHDVLAAGRSAGFTDPAGARFGVWQPGDLKGLDAVHVANTLGWTQLYTADPSAAKDFYVEVFAWDAEQVTLVRGATCVVVSPLGGGLPAAHGALMVPPPTTGVADAGDITGWHPYIHVEDCDSVFGTAVAHGATVVFPPETAAGIGRQATLRDPAGALFSVNEVSAA
jgi:predicted enzyme related to lactoylglutathione lyase